MRRLPSTNGKSCVVFMRTPNMNTIQPSQPTEINLTTATSLLRIKELEPQFVQHLPKALEDGKLYISMEFATAAHACCCGCGSEVITPFAPTDWSMSFDGEAVSLTPSIGNWYLPCRSHYVIRKGQVLQSRPWSEDQVEAEWSRDRKAKAAYYQPAADSDRESVSPIDAPTPPSWLARWWRRLPNR